MRFLLSRPSDKNCWSRFAALLSFLGVLSALLAPVSMLAQDVRTGKLGGVCLLTESLTSSSVSISIAGDAAGLNAADSYGVTPGDAAPGTVHCDLCASPCVAALAMAVLGIPSYPGNGVATVHEPADVAAFIPGLPFSRSPPRALI